MKNSSYKTAPATTAESCEKREWLLIDAENQTLGRLCSVIAYLLRGKHKTSYTPHVDGGDNVIVINAEKVHLTGKKWDKKQYIHYTGYPGGQRIATARELLNQKPTYLIEHAVKTMLPKSRLGHAMFRKLHVYVGSSHPHEAQQPRTIRIQDIK